MSNKRYTDEFKQEAVRHVTEHQLSIAEAARRLGVNKHSLYEWMKQFSPSAAMSVTADASELRRLRAELKRVTEERDILKKAATYFAKLSE
jgi:transposase